MNDRAVNQIATTRKPRTPITTVRNSCIVESIGMRERQDASVVVVRVRDGLEAKVGELGRNFSSAFRRFGFDDESVRAPAHNGDVVSSAKFVGGIKPRRILRAREEGHRGIIGSQKLYG